MARAGSVLDNALLLRIDLLGGFRVMIGPRTIEAQTWRLRKSSSLVKLLALAPDHRLHRDQIIDMLWPDLDPRSGANSLHQALHAARRVLDAEKGTSNAASILRLQQQMLIFQPAGTLKIDVEVFEAAVAVARRGRDTAAYAHAIELYTGDLLPEDRYEDWAAARRETLRELYLTLLLDVAQLHMARSDKEAAVAALERLVAHEPAHEEAHTTLMRLLADTGQRQAALRQYQRLREALRRELDVEPDGTSQQLYQEILTRHFRPGEDRPASVSTEQSGRPATRLHNLPVALTSFIGRERELAQVNQMLATTRLLTLTGPAGSGKTRLALAAAVGMVERYTDGVWLVDLGALTDGALLPRAVAGVLGIDEERHQSLTTTLVDALGSKYLLLIFDNCEHLVAAAAHLTHTLLLACAGVQVLVTSRTTLRVPGEIAWQVPSLSLPAPQQLPAAREELVAVLPTFEAVHLLLDRARWRQPTFAVTGENATAIVEICRRLDGIPLAIELAAARLAVLSAEEVARRLDEALWLLTDGNRTAAWHQQTLRATLDWSYALLTEQEQMVLCRLAVFTGGFALAAAEAVCGVPVLDLLAQLIDKSLVMVEEQEAYPPQARSRETRYRLLEFIRQYGLERLADDGEVEAVRQRHAIFYRDLVEVAEPHLAQPQRRGWWSRLERDHDNIRRALEWALAQGDDQTSLRLAGAMWQFWYGHGYQAEGRRWLEQVLARVDSGSQPEAPNPALAKALNGAGTIAWSQGDNARARVLLETSLELYRYLGYRQGIASSLHYLGAVAHHEEDYMQAGALYEECLGLRRELRDRHGIAAMLNNLGILALAWNDAARAQALLEECLALYRELHDAVGIAYALDSLARVARDQGDNERARSLFLASLQLLRNGQDNVCLVACIDGLAQVAAAQGQALRAVRLLAAAASIRERMGAQLSPIMHEHYSRATTSARAALDDHVYAAAWEAGRALTIDQAIDEALTD